MGCAGVITDALAGSGVQNLSKIPPNKGRGYVIVSGDVPDGELSKLADAVNKALTPHRAKVQPLVSLELIAKLDKQSAETAIKALTAVAGVDAENSTTDTDLGVLAVRLAGDKPVTVATITAALAKAGVAAKIATPPAAAPAAEETKGRSS